MNEALISGLLGAVMGGATSIEKSLAEEEAARRKEEEEKRREERALSLKEREREMERKRAEENERLKREKIAQTAPSKAPEIGIVGNAIDEYQGEIANTGYTGQTRQATPEEALRWSIGKAREEGNEELAKQREDALYKMLREGREAAKEAREQEEFGRGKPEKKTPQMQNVEDLAKEFYGGDDPERIAQARRQAINRIFPEREARGTPGQRPPTAGQLMAAEGRIGSKIKESFTEGFGNKKKVNQDLVDRAIPIAINLVDKSDPSKKLDVLKIQNDAISQVKSARKKAEDYAGSQWDALKDKGGVTRSRYIERNYLSYIDDYLSGGNPKEQESSAGAPWTRNWRQ